MDTGEQYIKMSEGVPRFLEGWSDGDLYAYRIDEPDCPFHYTDVCMYHYSEGDKPKQDAIRIYRQGQLQGMVLPDPNAKDAWGEPFEDDLKTDHVFWLFLDFSKTLQERKRSQQTGEQLWLRYVMKEKYGKCWNGEEWVIVDRGCG